MTSSPQAQARFGTFGGVFTPSCLTILGVIMFMRSGFVVGSAGVWQALLILLLAKSITTLTSLSLSAIATNTEVGTGGNYFMISRTLGADFGGAIGITLYISQAVAIAFYVIGFSEATFGMLAPPGSAHAAWIEAWRIEQWASTAVVLLLFFLTFKGADVALRAQYAILAVLLLSVASFLIGGILAFDGATFAANARPAADSVGFWAAFAIFFPAATGIEAGANMSGDLRDPARSIPRGTLLAVAFTGVIYFLELLLLGGFADSAELIADPFGTLRRMSVFAPLVVAGVLAGTLSSALGSFLGAPRILQAMGKDELLPPLKFFAKGHGPADEPRRATVLSLGIAVAVLWAGNLNAVAEVISMFFLIAYGMMNVSAFVEARSGNPSFRPRFRMYGWGAALAGAIGCAIAMIKIDETYALVSMAISAIIYTSLRGRTRGTWRDAKRGYVFSRTRENLLALERSVVDPKNWRPQMAVLTTDAARDVDAIGAAALLESSRGILSVIELVEADGSAPDRVALRRQRNDALRQALAEHRVQAFADAVMVDDVTAAGELALQAHSIGGLRPNTVFAALPPADAVADTRMLSRTLAFAAASRLNVTLYKGDGPAGRRRIDIWWHGQQNGPLMALYGHLISGHPQWRQVRIRTIRVVRDAEEHLEAQQSLAQLMHAARLTVDVEIIMSSDPVVDIIAEQSGTADLTMLGMSTRDLTDFDGYAARQEPLLSRIPRALLVASNGDIDLLA